MQVIKFKASYLNKSILWLIVIGILMSLMLFLTLNLATEYTYFLSMLFVSVGTLIVFYLNRNEPEQVQLDHEKIALVYFNKFFFKKPEANYTISELKSSVVNDRIVLSKNNLVVAIIRKASLVLADWEI